jgi:hypothetical protein
MKGAKKRRIMGSYRAPITNSSRDRVLATCC